MKIILVAAMSSDGYINPPGETNPGKWTSAEDKLHYKKALAETSVSIMGRGTYEAQKSLRSGDLTRTTIVFTHQTNVQNGSVTFTSDTPEHVCARLSREGHATALLLGGVSLYTQFLHDQLVDEVLLTIEPVTFGSGIPFLHDNLTLRDFSYLELVDEKTLNNDGTRLLHYKRKQNV